MNNVVFNKDCMIGMAETPDKYYDLAVVDPEFGIGIARSPRLVTDKGLIAKAWDDKPIDENYFTELFRVSKNQIIWGGNYYNLGVTKHCVIWDKKQPEKLSFGMFDFAWTSFDGANKAFRYHVHKEADKIHPTQKPVELYGWIFRNYAKPGMKILDTHVGSGSSRIAAHTYGLDYTGYEIDAEIYAAQELRFANYCRKATLFTPTLPPAIAM